MTEDDVPGCQSAKLARKLNVLGMVKMLVSKKHDFPF